MQTQRRTTLSMLGVVAASVFGWTTRMSIAQTINDAVRVTVKVQDETGNPIPYVTVWSAIQYDKRHANDTGRFQYINVSDLWRLTTRHQSQYEIISQFGDLPVTTLEIPSMGDRTGRFANDVDYSDLTGKSNNYPRPNPLVFGYTFMKRGYFPGKVDFSVPGSQSRVEATVTLQRNPAEAFETALYIQTFERVRYELSRKQDRSITPENQRRLQALGEQMEQAAQQAIVAGDKKAAARIYLRMRSLPSVLHQFDGRTEISGFSQANEPSSPESRHALDMAYQLDPDSACVRMLTYGRGIIYPVNATREQRIQINVVELEKLIARYGKQIWPAYYQRRADSYAELGDYAKARELYLEAALFEPKYTDWAKTLENMKLRMRIKKMPIPTGW